MKRIKDWFTIIIKSRVYETDYFERTQTGKLREFKPKKKKPRSKQKSVVIYFCVRQELGRGIVGATSKSKIIVEVTK